MSAAVVVGATGAVGTQLVLQLLESPAWNSVKTVGRRQLAIPAGQDATKLQQVVLDMDTLADRTDAFAGADACFCTLGTTRAAAGSAEAFIKVDLDYVAAAAKAAKAAGVKHFSLLTAQGSNARAPDVHWSLFHGLLYARCKGLAEQAVREQVFTSAAVFRPGLIERGAAARGMEKVMKHVVSSISAGDIAKVMSQTALTCQSQAEAFRIYEMKEMQKLAQ